MKYVVSNKKFNEIEFSNREKFHVDKDNVSLSTLTYLSKQYTTDDGLYIETKIFKPSACLEYVYINPYIHVPENTFVQYRLRDSNDHYYIDTNDNEWKIVDDNQWNTIEEINNDIHSWKKTSDVIDDKPEFSLVIYMKTNDSRVSPLYYGCDIVWKISDTYSSYEDVFFEAMIEKLESIPMIKEWASGVVGEDTDTLTMPSTNDYELKDIYGVYNLTDDKYRKNNLYVSHSVSGDNIEIQLKESLSSDKTAIIVFESHCPVHISTHPDFGSVRPPSIIIENIFFMNRSVTRGKSFIPNSNTENKGWIHPIHMVESYRVDCLLFVNRVRDLRFKDKIMEEFLKKSWIYSEALDEKWDLRYNIRMSRITTRTEKESVNNSFSFDILNVPVLLESAEEYFMVTNKLNLNKTRS